MYILCKRPVVEIVEIVDYFLQSFRYDDAYIIMILVHPHVAAIAPYSTFIIQMILTSQGHLSTAGGREGYLSIASTSGGYPFDSAEMTLVDKQSIKHNVAVCSSI